MLNTLIVWIKTWNSFEKTVHLRSYGHESSYKTIRDGIVKCLFHHIAYRISYWYLVRSGSFPNICNWEYYFNKSSGHSSQVMGWNRKSRKIKKKTPNKKLRNKKEELAKVEQPDKPLPGKECNCAQTQTRWQKESR